MRSAIFPLCLFAVLVASCATSGQSSGVELPQIPPTPDAALFVGPEPLPTQSTSTVPVDFRQPSIWELVISGLLSFLAWRFGRQGGGNPVYSPHDRWRVHPDFERDRRPDQPE